MPWIAPQKHDGYNVAAARLNFAPERLLDSVAEMRKKEKLWDDSCALLADMFLIVKAVANNVFFGSFTQSKI